MRIVRSELRWWLLIPRGRRRIYLRTLAARCGYRFGEMCAEIGCSERYLRRIFLCDLGLPPAEWLRLERMVEARHRLREGAGLEDVAEELGFSTPSSFGRLFKKIYGLAPRSFQRREFGRASGMRREA